MKAVHVGGGVPFPVDKDDMNRKTKENRMKVFKHRTGLIWSIMVRPVMKVVLIISGVILSVTFCIFFWHTLACWLTSDRDGQILITIFTSIASMAGIPAYWFNFGEDAVKNIRDRWNP